MTLVSGLSRRISSSVAKPSLGPVRVGRQAEVERHHGRFVRAQRLDRAGAVAGADDLIAFVGPFELALQALVVLDDEQHGKFGFVGHARFR